jgi:hypothetical protein
MHTLLGLGEERHIHFKAGKESGIIIHKLRRKAKRI